MGKIGKKKLADLCHRVGNAYKAGVDVKTIWEREAQHGSPRHRNAMEKVARKISTGGTVAEGLRSADDYFPELAIAVTEAGEQGGRMDRSLELLTRHYESIVRFSREMQTRLAWPVLQLVGAIVVIGLLILIMGWVAPEPVDWLGFGWSTMQYFWTYVTVVFLMVSGLFVAIYGSMVGWFGDYPMRIARKIPLLGKTIQIFALARFAWVMGAAYESGMNTMKGVGLAFRATQNYYYQQFESPVKKNLQAGQELTRSLRKTDAFPDDFLLHVENGELTGNVPETMTRAAEEYTAEAEKNLAIIAKVMFFIIFGVIACIIGFLVISLYAKYLNGFNQI